MSVGDIKELQCTIRVREVATACGWHGKRDVEREISGNIRELSVARGIVEEICDAGQTVEVQAEWMCVRKGVRRQ